MSDDNPTPESATGPSPYPPLKPEITFDDFARLDLRVGTVVQAEEHPNADRLLKLQVDLGFETRQICAGIKAHYTPEAILGKQIIVVANLAPRKIRGEVSNGMLMAASAIDTAPPTDGDNPAHAGAPTPPLADVVVLSPSAPVPPGSTVG